MVTPTGTVKRVVYSDHENAPVSCENTSKNSPAEGAEPQPAVAVELRLIDQLVDRAQAEGLQLTGEGGLQQLTKRLLESALEGEMTDHLGYARPGGEEQREQPQRHPAQNRAGRCRTGGDIRAP